MQFTEDDIEEWIEDEKKRLQKEFYKAIRDVEDTSKAKKTFNENMKSLLLEYEARYAKLWKDLGKKESSDKKKKELQGKIDVFKGKVQKEYEEEKGKILDKWSHFREDFGKKKTELELEWLDFWHRRQG